MRELEAYFQGVAERPQSVSQNVLLYGPVGSAARRCSRRSSALALEKKAATYGNRVKFLHVNCRIDRSLVAIFNKALRSLGHVYPSRGLSFEELLQALFEELRRDRVHMMVAFDEVDALVESDPSSLYTITRIREISPGRPGLLLPPDLEDAGLREDGRPEHPQLAPAERDIARALLRRAALRHTPLQEPAGVPRRVRRRRVAPDGRGAGQHLRRRALRHRPASQGGQARRRWPTRAR